MAITDAISTTSKMNVTRRTGESASTISSPEAMTAMASVLGVVQMPVVSKTLSEKIETAPMKTAPNERYAPASDQPATNPVRAPIVSPAKRYADPAFGYWLLRRAKHQAISVMPTVASNSTSGTAGPTCSASCCGLRFIAIVGAMPATATPIAPTRPTERIR